MSLVIGIVLVAILGSCGSAIHGDIARSEVVVWHRVSLGAQGREDPVEAAWTAELGRQLGSCVFSVTRRMPSEWSEESRDLRERCAGVILDDTALAKEARARMYARELVTSGLPLPSRWRAITFEQPLAQAGVEAMADNNPMENNDGP